MVIGGRRRRVIGWGRAATGVRQPFGRYWSSTDEGGWLRMPPQFRKLCLDVVNGSPQDGFAHMAECGDYSGRHWKLE